MPLPNLQEMRQHYLQWLSTLNSDDFSDQFRREAQRVMDNLERPNDDTVDAMIMGMGIIPPIRTPTPDHVDWVNPEGFGHHANLRKVSMFNCVMFNTQRRTMINKIAYGNFLVANLIATELQKEVVI